MQVKWHIFSYNAGLNSMYLHFYGTNKTSKNNEVQSKSEHNTAFPANWQKFTCDLLAFSRRVVKVMIFDAYAADAVRVQELIIHTIKTGPAQGRRHIDY